jgi:hypothetical protein
MKDKVELKKIELDRHLRLAQQELNDENLSNGQLGELHLEIEKLKFAIHTLNSLSYDN